MTQFYIEVYGPNARREMYIEIDKNTEDKFNATRILFPESEGFSAMLEYTEDRTNYHTVLQYGSHYEEDES